MTRIRTLVPEVSCAGREGAGEGKLVPGYVDPDWGEGVYIYKCVVFPNEDRWHIVGVDFEREVGVAFAFDEVVRWLDNRIST